MEPVWPRSADDEMFEFFSSTGGHVSAMGTGRWILFMAMFLFLLCMKTFPWRNEEKSCIPHLFVIIIIIILSKPICFLSLIYTSLL